MNETLSFNPDEAEIGVRIDKVIAQRLTQFSRNQVQEFIKDGLVRVNDSSVKASYKMEADDSISVELPPEDEGIVMEPKDIPLEILYEDDHVVVINKSAGMVVHPGQGQEEDTLVHALLFKYENLPWLEDDPTRAGVVHRLDKDTSGVIIVARTEQARDHLQAQFKERTVKKHYLALVEKHPPNEKGIIDVPISRDPKQRKRMAVIRDGKPATTEFQVRTYYDDHALLDVHPVTGRTHQIRVHLTFINCPIVGDKVYGYRKQRIKMKRMFLHAHRINFEHPISGERLSIEAPLPVHLEDVLAKLPK